MSDIDFVADDLRIEFVKKNAEIWTQYDPHTNTTISVFKGKPQEMLEEERLRGKE